MKRARPDHREVGRKDPELNLLLDLPDEVLEGGVLLDDHRCAFSTVVVYDDVHLVLPKREFPDEGLELGRGSRLLGNSEEGLEVLEDVVLDGVDVGGDLRDVGVMLLEFGDEVSDRVEGDVAV